MLQQQKKRAQNYTYEEALQLIRTVECYKDVVENKRTDAVTSNEKTKAWEKIAADFNAQTTTGRTGEQLRQKFDSLKKETRKYCAKLRQQRLQTGGGPHTEIKANPLYDRVQGLIKLSAEGNQSVFDSDATFLCEVPVESASGDSLQLLNVELDKDTDIQTEEDGSVSLPFDDLPSSSTEITWNKYSPGMLRTPKHPALNAGSYSIDSVPIPDVLKDQSSSPTLPLQMENHDVAGTSGTNTREAEVERPLLSRRKPIFRKKSLPLSATGKKIEPWVTARTEVAQLQKRLLEEQLREVQKRDEREAALFHIKKRSLELDVKIKEETLKNLTK
ncbi:uncharacterized protein [Anabrus simplex]|uniref:uncharacterized protein n=1 Tax=Anabrus simplex TaxID=316456 RepID=UPI0035A30190